MNIDIQGILRGLAELEVMNKEKLDKYAEKSGLKMEAYAKQNAPWRNITGQARRTLKGGKMWEGNKVNVYISGNMEYSPTLEYEREGKYRILGKTVEDLSQSILNGIKL